MTEIIEQITSPTGATYVIGSVLGENEIYTTYKCTLPDKRICFLKMARSVACNGLLDREAYVLQSLKNEATRIEESYAEEKPDNPPLNYHICFPKLEETFLAEKQGGLRMNVLSFFELTDSITDLAPMAYISSREEMRVDPKTSAWMLGKTLKFLRFTQSVGISIGKLSGEKILLQRENHLIGIYDWTNAVMTEAPLDEDSAREEIVGIAQAAILALGGNPITGILPESEQLSDSRFATFLKQLADGKECSAKNAHITFYELIESMWGKKYHPYTAYELNK